MSIVSPGVRVEANAELDAAVVLPGAHIGTGSKIRNAIVGEKTVISAHSRIGYDPDADLARFPVSENGIVIVGAHGPHVPRSAFRGSNVLPWKDTRKRASSPTPDRL